MNWYAYFYVFFRFVAGLSLAIAFTCIIDVYEFD